ncbi:MAG TPA: DUF1573 domain-containing protein [Rariglobus sp.]|jgi:hypothetical protein|nr:DUF1573 domain-containing protein [Rariglobus sp.]
MHVSPRNLFVAGISALGLFSYIHASPAEAPALHLTPGSLDMGRQVQQEVIEQEVAVRNEGDTPLVILSVKGDCDCTSATLKDDHLAPGAATTLRVRFETRTYTGAVHRQIAIATNQGLTLLPVSIRVTPYKDWDISPMPVLMAPSVIGKPADMDITVKHFNDGGLHVIEAATNRPWLKAKVGASTSTGLQNVSLSKAPDAPAGTHVAVLSLKTNDPDAPLLKATVLVRVVAELRVAPDPILLPSTAVGVETSAAFSIVGWHQAAPPVVRSDRGTITRTGETGGGFSYMLTWTPVGAGVTTWSVEISNDEKTMLKVSVIHHADEAKPAAVFTK